MSFMITLNKKKQLIKWNKTTLNVCIALHWNFPHTDILVQCVVCSDTSGESKPVKAETGVWNWHSKHQFYYWTNGFNGQSDALFLNESIFCLLLPHFSILSLFCSLICRSTAKCMQVMTRLYVNKNISMILHFKVKMLCIYGL